MTDQALYIQKVLFLFLLLFFASALTSVIAAPIPELLRSKTTDLRPNQERLVPADRELLLELIKLARFNIHFHQEANRRWNWRNWLFPLAQESGTGASYANTLTDLVQRSRGLKNLDLVSASARKRGLSSAIAGNAVSGTSSAAELAQNGLVVLLAGGKGYSPKDSIDFVNNELSTVDKLLAHRQKIVDDTSPGPMHQTYELEGRLLQQVRDQLLLEFERWSAQSREQMWRQNTFYAIDCLENFASMGSSIVSLKAFSAPSLRGGAAICALAANSMAALNPPIRNTVGVLMRKHQRRRLARSLPEHRPGPTRDLMADWANLNRQISEGQPSSGDSQHIEEVSFLAEGAETEESMLTSEQNRIERLRQVAIQQSISGPAIGMASVARSLLATIAFYGYRDEPEVRNKLGFAGRISQTCGQTYSLINTPATRISQTIYTRDLKARGQLPSQLLEKRLERLDELENAIRGTRRPGATTN